MRFIKNKKIYIEISTMKRVLSSKDKGGMRKLNLVSPKKAINEVSLYVRLFLLKLIIIFFSNAQKYLNSPNKVPTINSTS